MHNGIEHILELFNDPVFIAQNTDANPLTKEQCRAQAKELASQACCLDEVNAWIESNSFLPNAITANRIRRFYAEERAKMGTKFDLANSAIPVPSPLI